MTSEPWWTCNICGSPLYKAGKGKPDKFWEDHRQVCSPRAGGSIVQWDQRDLKKARKRAR